MRTSNRKVSFKDLPAFEGFAFSFAEFGRVCFSIFVWAGGRDVFFFSMLCLSFHTYIILELRCIKKTVSDDGLGQKND